jgi:PAS domain-containing protein
MDSLCLNTAPPLAAEPPSGRLPQDRGPELAADLDGSIREARLRRLYAYWRERKGDRRMPARRDIDPIDFAYLLGNIMLVDVIRDPLRFRVRLHGTALVRLSAYELTGKLLDELPDTAYRAYAIERCRGLVESGEPATSATIACSTGGGATTRRCGCLSRMTAAPSPCCSAPWSTRIAARADAARRSSDPPSDPWRPGGGRRR